MSLGRKRIPRSPYNVEKFMTEAEPWESWKELWKLQDRKVEPLKTGLTYVEQWRREEEP